VKILLISPLYPPLHAGTYDLRVQALAEALKVRGHELRVLTSNHGLQGSQQDDEIERRLILAGSFGHSWVSGLSAMEEMETENHRALQEALAGYRPEGVLVTSLMGLSKSLVFGLHQSGVPSVFGVSDDWMVPGLAEDPWLRWWNAPGLNASRAALEMGGKRRRLDRTAPTRLARGYDRMPELYGKAEGSGGEVRWVAGFRFDGLYFASRDLQQRAVQAGFRVAEMPVIPDAVATSVFQGVVSEVERPLQRVMMLGPFGPTSGLDTALSALKALGDEGRRMELTAYGRGESGLLAPLRSYAVQHGLKLQLLAPSDEGREMAGMFHRQDLLVDAREHAEGSALRVTQAMACGLPVVSTGLGAAADWVVPEETGLRFSPGNYEQLAQQWHRLSKDPALRVRLATAGQARVNAEANETIVLDRIEEQMQQAREMRATP
jgi:glycosyltransferase involved in cell wall biosynthesis